MKKKIFHNTRGLSKCFTNVNFQTIAHVTANICNNTLHDTTTNNSTEVVKPYLKHRDNHKLKELS